MKTFLRTCIAILSLLLGASTVHSNNRDDKQDPQQQAPQSRQQRDASNEQRQQERASNQERRNTYRSPSRQEIQADDDAARKNGRMSPEERRDLRRQIDEANQNISSQKR